MRIPRGTLVWLLVCNYAGARGCHGGTVEIIVSIELGIGGHACVNPRVAQDIESYSCLG
jgi:hypothetical protein